MRSSNHFIRISFRGLRRFGGNRWGNRCRLQRRWSIVGFKHIQPFQLLVENRKRLEPFSFDHLGFEPILGFGLLDLLQIFMDVIKMSVRFVRIGRARRIFGWQTC